jgi:uncharacterized MAPEG superfamily protein
MSAEKQDDKLPATAPAQAPDAGKQGAQGAKRTPPNFLQVMLSVVAAAFGVQTGKNYERDFSTGNPLAYIAGGLLFTVLFVLAIATVVSLVLP